MPIPAYSGSFGKPQLLHLLRRTLFGVTKADLTAFSGKTLSQAVEELLTDLPAPAPPVVDYAEASLAGTSGTSPSLRNWYYTAIPQGQTWINDRQVDNRIYNGNRQTSLRRWWLNLMINQDRNIREKMVLFWHNHIPTDIGSVVTEPIHMYRYNALLRQYALGNFKTLVRLMTTEPAMLVYLSGRSNTKTAPNENYARELQELFTIGKDLPAYYTENDVRAAAKVLTGWQLSANITVTENIGGVDYSNIKNDYSFAFNNGNHDTTNKTFSSFYSNTVVTGRTGTGTGTGTVAAAGETELNDLLNMIFAHSEVAKYVVRKLYRFFVHYNIDATIESQVITPLADTFRTNSYDIKPVLRELFNSQHFFDTQKSTACLIKNPADYVIGMVRTFGASTVGADLNGLDSRLNNMQMRIGNPPNVAGWIAYYQTPNFHQLWINAETLRRRKEFNDSLLLSNINNLKIDVLAFTRTLDAPSDPNALIDEVVELLHINPMDAAVKTQLKNILLSGQAQDYYWTDAWVNYISAPTNTSYVNIVQGRLRTFYQAITNMAEYHIG